MSNVRSVFMGEGAATDVAKHEQQMRVLREQRAKMITGVLAVVMLLSIILLVVGAVCAAALLVRATFG